MSFLEYYAGQAAELAHSDLSNLGTANKLDDRLANYERFAVILDRRFADWEADQKSDVRG